MLYRRLFKREKRLVQKLAAQVNLALKPTWEAHMIVSPMQDGGMGSLRLYPNGITTQERQFGRQVSSCLFKDKDNVDVIATLNLDKQGNMYELDLWKVDFQPIIALPPTYEKETTTSKALKNKGVRSIKETDTIQYIGKDLHKIQWYVQTLEDGEKYYAYFSKGLMRSYEINRGQEVISDKSMTKKIARQRAYQSLLHMLSYCSKKTNLASIGDIVSAGEYFFAPYPAIPAMWTYWIEAVERNRQKGPLRTTREKNPPPASSPLAYQAEELTTKQAYESMIHMLNSYCWEQRNRTTSRWGRLFSSYPPDVDTTRFLDDALYHPEQDVPVNPTMWQRWLKAIEKNKQQGPLYKTLTK